MAAVPATVSRPRAIAAVTGLLAAAGAVVLAPGVAAEYAARRVGRELVARASTEQQALAANREWRRLEGALTTLAQFERSRRSSTLLLAALTDALSPETALAELRVDTLGAELVVLSTRAAAVLSALDQVPGVVAPELVGAVHRTAAGARELERATLRFRYEAQAVQDTVRLRYPVSPSLPE
jgi:hypothetical protein